MIEKPYHFFHHIFIDSTSMICPHCHKTITPEKIGWIESKADPEAEKLIVGKCPVCKAECIIL